MSWLIVVVVGVSYVIVSLTTAAIVSPLLYRSRALASVQSCCCTFNFSFYFQHLVCCFFPYFYFSSFVLPNVLFANCLCAFYFFFFAFLHYSRNSCAVAFAIVIVACYAKASLRVLGQDRYTSYTYYTICAIKNASIILLCKHTMLIRTVRKQ